MREVTAYFLVYQGKDAFPGVGEEAADQRGRRDGNRPMLVLPVVVAALLDHPLAVFVVSQIQIDGPVQLVFQSGAQTDDVLTWLSSRLYIRKNNRLSSFSCMGE